MPAKRTAPARSTPARKRPARKSTAPAPAKKAARPAPPKARRAPVREREDGEFPIVAIGASAGGLAALTDLLHALPPDTGMAYVVIQHLDPHHASQLTELLGRASSMPVAEIQDDLRPLPNRVYVIPPNKRLAMQADRLRLTARGSEVRPNVIDHFFQTLAQARGRRAIGVVLSGTGTDGTLGLMAIRAEGGLTFAQQEESAEFDSMPHSAIVAGVVDFSLPPGEMALELARLGRHPYVNHAEWPAPRPALAPPSAPAADDALGEILALLKTAAGVDLASYKQTTLRRRIHRRMVLARLDSLEAYARHLRQTPPEVTALYEDIFIHVTGFFREARTYEVLAAQVFPSLARRRPPDMPIRVWVAGCSTGEEAYSIAMTWLEFAADKSRTAPIQLFATDISPAAIEQARAGLYSERIQDSVSPARLRRFFDKAPGGYRIGKVVRDLCVFAPHNLVQDPPFTQLDLISCCNVLIYLEPAFQKNLIPLFHYALKPGGFLVLGASESIGTYTDLFEKLNKREHVYARQGAAGQPRHSLLPASGWQRRPGADPAARGPAKPAPGPEWDMNKEADQAALAQYAPASVIVRRDLEILQFRGHVGPFLEPAAGQPSHNLRQMARPGLQAALPALVHKAQRTQAPARQDGLRLSSGGRERVVSLQALPLKPGPKAKAELFLISFEETTAPALVDPKGAPRGQAALAARQLARQDLELAEARETLRAVLAEREVDHEELTAALEELQSGNEELQSTNEELQSAKEEMQSANEEMTTLNEELDIRSREATQALSDLNNLTDTAQIPMALVGGDGRLRFVTPAAGRVLHLTAGDLGRPIADIKIRLSPTDLPDLITQVIESQRPLEQEVQDPEGRWYVMRLWPYVRLDRKIDGAAISWLDVTAIKAHAAQLAAARDFSDAVVVTVGQPLLVLDAELRVQAANPAFYQTFQVAPPDTLNRRLAELGNHQWDIPELGRLLGEILTQNSQVRDYEIEHDFESLGRRTIVLNARRIDAAGQLGALILLTVDDITARRRARENLHVLAEVGRELALAEDEPTRLARLASLIVPQLADWCTIELGAPGAEAGALAAAHADPEKLRSVQALRYGYLREALLAGDPRDRRPRVYPDVSAALLEELAADSRQLKLLRNAGLRSLLRAPIFAGDQVLGTLSLARTAAARAYTAADLELADALAARIGLALDNTRLYHQTRALNAELQAANARLTAEAAERQKAADALEASRTQLRRLAIYQDDVREEERRRISHDIHDELGQELTGFKMDLAQVRHSLEGGPPSVLDRLAELTSEVDGLVNSVRRIAADLRPPMLDEIGLQPAIEWQLADLQRRSGLRCRLAAGDAPFAMTAERITVVFRVFQEILTNVVRHAQATRVEVQLESRAGELVLVVRDNGRGISAQEAAGNNSMGLLGMRERLQPVGGTLNLHGVAGQGTTATVRLPLTGG